MLTPAASKRPGSSVGRAMDCGSVAADATEGALRIADLAHVADRFWRRVDQDTGPVHPTLGRCWPWKAGKSNGYGVIRYSSHSAVKAHRVAYVLSTGPLESDVLVRHKCDYPPCCNPQHLEVGSHADNASDMVDRGRSLRGERQSRAVLTAPQVLEIRTAVAAGKRRGLTADFAKKFGVSRDAVSGVVLGRSWKWLTLVQAVRP